MKMLSCLLLKLPGALFLFERFTFRGKVIRFLRESGAAYAARTMWQNYGNNNVISDNESEALENVEETLRKCGLEAEVMAKILCSGIHSNAADIALYPGPNIQAPAVLLFGLGFLSPVLSDKTKEEIVSWLNVLRNTHGWGAVRNPAHHAHRIMSATQK